ncbi:trypsin-like peptidase domain-containing protein [Streptomyces sp. NPDC005931]|uniref:S1C family serine protease n=1 Tax=Streptomyces sp. NPDC005931 TaxID=3364737 RepID=UPI0036844204
MNEGKPTKAKWWSRPRPQGPSGAGEPEEAASADAVHGDAEPGEAARPEAARTEPEARHVVVSGHDGDYELARPAAPRHGTEGDYALDRPTSPAPAPRSPGAFRATDHTEGPAGGSPSSPAPSAPTAPSEPTGADESAGGVSAPPGESVAPGASVPLLAAGSPGSVPSASAPTAAPAPQAFTPPGEAGPAAPSAAVRGEAPRPLHDPDPYSTPPYGEPGPWAPAPPVQHPAVTPAHGTALTAPLPADTPAHGTSVPPSQQHVTPAPTARAPDPWRRYDPWAAASRPAATSPAPTAPVAVGPLQQSGAGVIGEARRRGRARRTVVGAFLVVALVSGVGGGIVGAYLERNGGIGTVELPQAGKESVERPAGSVAGIAAQALPSVVTLHVSGAGEAGTGTGFVLDTRGHILTNDHVVEPAGSGGEITVTFNSGDTAEATVVGRDKGYDLAVVKVKGVRGLTPLPLGNSDNVRVGDPVVAIGAPFDLAGTVTSGIISAKQRPITAGGEKGDGSDVSYVDALQTDAPINPGNSGGPLLDAKARVIGINSAIRSAGAGPDPEGGPSGSIGLGFAIPINQGKRVAEELINSGRATHPVIGITLDMDYTGDGARVGTEGSDGGPPVSTGGPGDKAGIKPGDVITEVDGRRIHSGEELIVKTRAHRPGDRLELTLERGGKERTVSLVLGSSGGD